MVQEIIFLRLNSPRRWLFPFHQFIHFPQKNTKAMQSVLNCLKHFGLHIPRITSALLVGISGNWEKSQPFVRKQN